jgi:L-fucose isomerase-like protein
MTIPKVGFVTCVHPIYSLPSVIRLRDDAISSLQAVGCEVIPTAIAREPGEIPEIVAVLKNNDIDLLLFFFCTWVAEEITLTLARKLEDVPLLLWALPYFDRQVPMPSPMTGLMATGCNLARTGRTFLHRVGGVTSGTIQEVARTARVAMVVKRLPQARFGIVGSPCPGMIDTKCDDTPPLGVIAVRRELDDLLRAREAASAWEASAMAERLVSTVGRSDVALETISEHYRLYLGLESIVDADRMDAISVRCWPELRDQHKTLICLALSEMAERGTPTACEADLTTLVTSHILTQLSGKPSCSLEITASLEEQQALQFAHCGVAAISMAGDEKNAAVRSHMRTGAGALVEFAFPPGQVTIAKLIRPLDGLIRMFVGRGEVIPTAPSTRGSIATIRVEPSPAEFIDILLENAVEHHLVVVYGDWTEELAQFAKFARIQLVRTGVKG